MSYSPADLMPYPKAEYYAAMMRGLAQLVEAGAVDEQDGRYSLRGAVPPVLPSTGSGLNSAGGPLRGERAA